MPSEPVSDPGLSFQKMFERNNLPWIGALALLGGVLARLYLHKEAFRDSSGAFCDAIFIAAFLAYAVDPVLKQGLLKEGIKNIFSYLYGYSLPSELQRFYDETIVATKVMRRDCSLHWHVSEGPGTSDRLALGLHVSFGIVNFTDEDRFYTHVVFATSDTPGEQGSVEALYCRDLEQGTYEYEFKKGQLPAVKNGDVVKKGYWSGNPIRLLAEPTRRKTRYKFGVHYYSESWMASGIDSFRVKEVTTDIEVLITVDPALKDHLFSVIPPPPNSEDAQKPALDIQTREYRCCWKFSRLFAPNETLSVRWQSPEVPSSSTGSGTTA